MAPEVILCETVKDTPYSYKADVWSLGKAQYNTYISVLPDFSLTVKAAPHKCVIRTSQP